MRVLLSTIGSRGDVQPMVALALQLRELGQEVRICAPPDFREWIGTLGIPFVPVGPEVRQTAAPSPSAAQAPPTPEQLRQLMKDTVSGQFEAITAAARAVMFWWRACRCNSPFTRLQSRWESPTFTLPGAR
jgi:vancomycin aglycone glucosyltransferase